MKGSRQRRFSECRPCYRFATFSQGGVPLRSLAISYNQVPTSAGETGNVTPEGIAFESPEVQLQKLRERLCQMSDEELIKFGKQVRALSAPRVSVTPDPWPAQLEEARAEWRRRHPKAQ